MALTKNPHVVGMHAWFVTTGTAFTVPGAGTTARDAKPGATDTSWLDLGILKGVGIQPSEGKVEIFAPTPGVKRLYKIINTMPRLKFTLTLEELSAFVMQLLFKSLALTSASTQFNPIEGPIAVEGWLKIQGYDETDTVLVVVDAYVHIVLTNDMPFDGESLLEAQLECSVLHSTLNTGTL